MTSVEVLTCHETGAELELSSYRELSLIRKRTGLKLQLNTMVDESLLPSSPL